MVSSTARMKHALTCCGAGGADVEPDRRVEAEDLVHEHVGQLVLEDLRVLVGGEVAVLLARLAVGLHDAVDDLACSEVSRCGVPRAPRKYLVVTMFAALTDQKSGNSTPRCSKLTEPSRQLVITTSRDSQVTASYGCTPAVV